MGHDRSFKAHPSAGRRMEACPPGHPRIVSGLCRAAVDWWCNCLNALRPGALPAEVVRTRRLRERELACLHAAKDDFDDALEDLPADAVRDLHMQVEAARSLHELWHLRAGVFGAVARHLDQGAAAHRLALMNRHFPTRSARSGFVALDDAS